VTRWKGIIWSSPCLRESHNERSKDVECVSSPQSVREAVAPIRVVHCSRFDILDVTVAR
jgi:hypothetical protein